MNKLKLIIGTLLLISFSAIGYDCKNNLEYRRNLAHHENQIRELKLNLREDMIDKCPRNKLSSKFCKTRLAKFKQAIEQKDAEFLETPLNAKCSNKNKDIVKSTRNYFQKPNKHGYLLAGNYREQHSCMDSQQANQTCRDINKVLKKCGVKDGRLYVKCEARSSTNSKNICYEASPILSLLTSEYSVCQVSIKDLEKFAPCLAQSAKDNRQRLCPQGCHTMPIKKMCNWEEEEINNYLGCLQIANKTQYNELCPNRKKLTRPKTASVKSPVKGCPNTFYPGKVNPWSLLVENEFPHSMKKSKFLKVSATPREYLSIAFRINKNDFIKKLKDGDDFAEEGESINQRAKGSGTFYLFQAPGYTGNKQFSISSCPGQFKEDGIDATCIASSDKNSKIYWEVNGEGLDTCQLKPGRRYFYNVRFTRGCNWKQNCAVKVRQIRN